MNAKKCTTCKWRVIMSYCDGRKTELAKEMCHYTWKDCKKVRQDECHYNAKRSEEIAIEKTAYDGVAKGKGP